ncbi:hypothetical protein DFJ73DRAFT_358478 [Zopfochytrium polystomum]|nr:hypothetical protein DFJ73DRAFT_358478 [Zopfochytrium polystomum]
MILWNNVRFACERCQAGHRSASCDHVSRRLLEIRDKGRPATQCSHCREKRRAGSGHSHHRCLCGDAFARARRKVEATFSTGLVLVFQTASQQAIESQLTAQPATSVIIHRRAKDALPKGRRVRQPAARGADPEETSNPSESGSPPPGTVKMSPPIGSPRDGSAAASSNGEILELTVLFSGLRVLDDGIDRGAVEYNPCTCHVGGRCICSEIASSHKSSKRGGKNASVGPASKNVASATTSTPATPAAPPPLPQAYPHEQESQGLPSPAWSYSFHGGAQPPQQSPQQVPSCCAPPQFAPATAAAPLDHSLHFSANHQTAIQQPIRLPSFSTLLQSTLNSNLDFAGSSLPPLVGRSPESAPPPVRSNMIYDPSFQHLHSSNSRFGMAPQTPLTRSFDYPLSDPSRPPVPSDPTILATAALLDLRKATSGIRTPASGEVCSPPLGSKVEAVGGGCCGAAASKAPESLEATRFVSSVGVGGGGGGGGCCSPSQDESVGNRESDGGSGEGGGCCGSGCAGCASPNSSDEGLGGGGCGCGCACFDEEDEGSGEI